MARPLKFNVDEALDCALGVFWQKGYESTTTAVLAQAMGIQKGSLFNKFGDKRSLYLLALKRYLDRASADLQANLEGAEDPVEALSVWVVERATICSSTEGQAGCFIVNTTIEMAGQCADIGAITKVYWGELENQLARVLQGGQERGEIRAEIKASTLAHLLMTHLAGMNVIARQGVAPSYFERCTHALFASFRP
ncbi:MAG: TetR/AcrR family transcriptional regulator [Planctomycetes bacterium]|nr:TetR/AcrR family transcriptional regulator [Planctomycetota bacterium]